MNKKLQLKAVALAAVALFGACKFDEGGVTPGLLNDLWDATLTPGAEVPGVVATSTGTAHLILIDTNTIRVQTLVAGIDSVTQAHIHAGDAATAGPIMVFLAGPFTGTPAYARSLAGTPRLDGVLSHVDIIRGVTLFSVPYNFDSLRTRINAGTAYVNVHTRANPGGEIRGQLVVVP